MPSKALLTPNIQQRHDYRAKIMSAKQTATSLLNQLDDNANWEDVKDTIMSVYKRETGDAKADAIAAVVITSVFVVACITWIGSQ